MHNLAHWLSGIEQLAYESYLMAAKHFDDDKELNIFLSSVAEDEAWHYMVMLGAADHFEHHGVKNVEAISVDEETNNRIVGYFKAIKESIAENTITKQVLLENLTASELSEWNDIFIYVANELKDERSQFRYAVAELQRHRSMITSFAKKRMEKSSEMVTQLAELPKVWIENILVVDDDSSVRELLAAILRTEGAVDVAENGAEALELLDKKYYKLVLSDINMPIMGGIPFYQEAIRKFPGISDRFLFMSGGYNAQQQEFIINNNISPLSKPISISTLREEAGKVLLKKEVRINIEEMQRRLSPLRIS